MGLSQAKNLNQPKKFIKDILYYEKRLQDAKQPLTTVDKQAALINLILDIEEYKGLHTTFQNLQGQLTFEAMCSSLKEEECQQQKLKTKTKSKSELALKILKHCAKTLTLLDMVLLIVESVIDKFLDRQLGIHL
ncbi:hypothetical protein SELMODRAFT_417155 [Selaginella moellendorffii]|uniref:Uncharacterized protein n=1 Tax=Selaginella moellendorffii TaxID=88036 RepID=D8S1J4_SELML|nr:hypothetical protein SELMODRAFT_417155 [Selaginella moellendorffii]